MASRIRQIFLAVLVAFGLAAGLQVAPASAQAQVDISVFHDRLAPYGQWVQSPRYGWAWYPTGVEVGWRPYTHGHWIWTDDYGWYWQSDYAWGWAPFHYGRWALDDQYGWIWVPGSEWGPAWVSWRSGGGYVGWAPMPPEAVWHAGGGWGGFDLDVHFGPAWSFCDERYLAGPRLAILPPEQNVTIINRTTNVTNYVNVNNHIVNRSIDVHRIETASNTRITPMHVRDVDRPESGGLREANGEVHAFRPTIERSQAASPSSNEVKHQQAITERRQEMQAEQPMHRPEVRQPQNPQVVQDQRQREQLQRQALKQQEEQKLHQEQQKQQHQANKRQQLCRQDPAACEQYQQ
jgi:flagellar biosynthesis GTPase FlhF